MKYWTNRQVIMVITVILLVSHCITANTQIHSIHFLIPGGAGGGWDGTARGVGEALTKSDLIKRASYQNMSGGGGGRTSSLYYSPELDVSISLLANSQMLHNPGSCGHRGYEFMTIGECIAGNIFNALKK